MSLFGDEVLIIMIYQIDYLMWSQPDTIKLIEIVEDRDIFINRKDFTGCFLCLHHEFLFNLEGIFWREGTGIADFL